MPAAHEGQMRSVCCGQPETSRIEKPAGYTLLMDVVRHEFELASEGHGHVYDLSDEVTAWLVSIAASDGQLTVFVPGSTAVVTTIEFEAGAVRDLVEALERLAPSDRSYHHDLRWGDGNGFSHLRAALLGPSLTVPVAGGRCVVGTWQQIVLVECDLAPRRRRVVLSYVGLVGREG
jgi:secondary thiamine-phosphate synthase enzyme